MTFSERKVVMTGASGGIGRFLADLLLARGAKLVTISRAGIGPYNAKNLQSDLSTSTGIDAASAIVADEAPDVLINLAGIQYFGRFDRQPSRELEANYRVNLVAPAMLCRAAIPAMQRRRCGQIVNIGSTFGSVGFAHFVSYSSAKAGLRVLSEALRREMIDTGIAVTYIAPRAVKTAIITAQIERYARLTGMAIDDPVRIATAMVTAIERRRKDVYFGIPESLLARLNGVMPGLIDRLLVSNDRKARTLFSSKHVMSEGSL
jgi:short-subunit dehydrogenase